MAYHDSLTDLPNRTAFNECFATTLARAVQTGESYAVLCLDLDRFKEVNDVFGHAVGDLLLCEVSRRLREAAGNAYLSRLGGDEFALIATGEGLADTQRLAERLQGMVADPMMIGGVELRTALSIGIAIFPADGRDPTSLLANADAALGRAKAEGRGAVRFFDADTDQRLRERRALQQDLGSAIDRNEFVLHYQPQVRIDGEMIGFEALVRWNHPFHGWVSPATFIPLADESGLIVALGAWILREACREAASWPRPLSIAVNLSPVQFGQDDLVSLVHSVLLEAALDPSRLELEITESVMIDDFPRAMSILRRLKSLGVRIAMDDFGTGYSSLSYLQSFPFDKIKIDRSFISQLETNPQSAAIVRAVIGLARGLGVPVLAEGVETQGQVACLAREGCDEMQGYLLGRPLPIEDQAERVGRATPAGRLRRLA